MVATPSAAAIYLRISSDPRGDQLGVTRQKVDCLAEATRRGWTISEIYTDDDCSAFGAKRRPEYQRLLSNIRLGIHDGVMTWRLDRLHRRLLELEEFLTLTEVLGVRLATVTGDVDIATSSGRAMARTMGTFGMLESEVKSERIRRKHQELAEKGKVSGGGTRPFGYTVDRRDVVEDEAAVIRELAERILAGDSLRSTCTNLNDRGVKTVTARAWTPTVLRNMLLSARISGQREHLGEIVGRAEWPAIISRRQTTRLRALLTDPDRRTNRTARRYLLAGLVRCASCDTKMVARPREDGRRRYVCAIGPSTHGCGSTVIVADELEVFVIAGLLHRLDEPSLARALARSTSTNARSLAAQASLADAEQRLEELAIAYADGAVTFREWQAARPRLLKRVAAAKTSLHRDHRALALDGLVGNSDKLRNTWDSLTLARQQAIAAALLDHVSIGPAVRGRNRFDESRVRPAWRRAPGSSSSRPA
jgi:DNA invertase Pin-like site-specific DNA recombinase